MDSPALLTGAGSELDEDAAAPPGAVLVVSLAVAVTVVASVLAAGALPDIFSGAALETEKDSADAAGATAGVGATSFSVEDMARQVWRG